MSEISAEKLAQRIYECGLLSMRECEESLAAAGGRGRATLDSIIEMLLQRELLTNWQISRVCENQRRGYFYGNWKMLYLIGAGTFARVYRAEHTKTNDIKAVKVLRHRYSSDIDTRESFMSEAKLVMKLRHPNIVPIHEVEEYQGRIYMVMDFIEGQNLREYVKAHRKLPVLTSLKIIRDILAGLKYAAGKGIYHRDMKLSNVLLSSRGQAKLVDFGLAVNVDDKEKGGPRSIDYAGLERCTGVRRNDPRSDLFFVGCMLYHMVSGEPPLLETRERIKRLSQSRYTDTVPVTVHEPNLPHRVVALINRLMAFNPEQRSQSADAAHQEAEVALRAVEAGDLKRYDAALSDNEAYQQSLIQRDEGADKTVLLIESNVKVQDSLREKLKDLGYRVLITSDPSRGLSRFEDLDPADDRPADCVIFGCAGLGRDAVDAFEEFTRGNFTSSMPAILIGTEKTDRYVKPEFFNDHRISLQMPIKFKHVKRSLRKLLNINLDDRTPITVGSGEATLPVNDADQDTDVELD
ncbi:MAG: serine/threonine-protein kinase [Planctomycetota bacterium]